MHHRLTHSEGSERLLLVFADWGNHAERLVRLSRKGYDVAVVDDYSSFFIDWSFTRAYVEICLIACGLGVYAASQTTQAIDHKITRRVAVNGTMSPLDDCRGIPEDVFAALLSSEQDGARLELQTIADRLILHTPSDMRWDLALIGRDDRLFSRRNQQRAWEEAEVAVEIVRGGHFIDVQEIVNRHFIDKKAAQKCFRKSLPTYDDHAAVQAEVVERMMEMCRDCGVDRAVMQAHNTVLEIGSGTGMLSRRVVRLIGDATLMMWDIAAREPRKLTLTRKCRFQRCDAEMAIAQLKPGSVDHIFSASTVEWLNSPTRFVAHCARALRPGGYLVVSTFTKGHMHELAEITGIGLPLMSADDWRTMGHDRLELVDCQAYSRDVDFESPADILRHLQHIGANSLSHGAKSTILGRRILKSYPMMLDARYHLTYCPIILIFRRR